MTPCLSFKFNRNPVRHQHHKQLAQVRSRLALANGQRFILDCFVHLQIIRSCMLDLVSVVSSSFCFFVVEPSPSFSLQDVWRVLHRINPLRIGLAWKVVIATSNRTSSSNVNRNSLSSLETIYFCPFKIEQCDRLVQSHLWIFYLRDRSDFKIQSTMSQVISTDAWRASTARCNVLQHVYRDRHTYKITVIHHPNSLKVCLEYPALLALIGLGSVLITGSWWSSRWSLSSVLEVVEVVSNGSSRSLALEALATDACWLISAGCLSFLVENWVCFVPRHLMNIKVPIVISTHADTPISDNITSLEFSKRRNLEQSGWSRCVHKDSMLQHSSGSWETEQEMYLWRVLHRSSWVTWNCHYRCSSSAHQRCSPAYHSDMSWWSSPHRW